MPGVRLAMEMGDGLAATYRADTLRAVRERLRVATASSPGAGTSFTVTLPGLVDVSRLAS